MTLMIMGAIMIFLSTLLGVFLLVLSMPIIFNFITNEIWLEKLFLRFGKENFSFALIKLKNDLMSNLVIYVFFGILITLFFVLVTIVISQIRHRKNHKVAIRLFYTNFALTGIIFTILVLMIIFTGIWWFSFILAVLAMGLFFLQNSFLSLIKNSINHKEYQIGNIITAGDGKISNENYLDINNEIVNIRKNSIQAQQSLSLVKEQLQSEFLNDKDYETNEIDNNKLVVKSKASLPDILNPMLLKENKDDGDAIRKIIAEPIYQKDSKNNVISSDEQKEADDKNQVDINNEYLQVKQPEECSYVAPSELEDDDGKQPLMSNSSQTGSREDDFVKQSFANGYYQGQQYSQVQEQIVPLGEQKEADGKNQVDINNEYLQVKQPEECSYVAPSELEDNDGKQPLMSNSSQTGSREDDFVKQSFANGYYQGQQYSQVQEQIVPLGEQKEADGKNQVDINNEYLQVKQPEECSYVAPSELEDDDGKQPLMSNSSQTGSREDDFVKQSFANGYYQGQQYSQVQEQIVPLGEQKEADGKNQVDINNEYLQVKQPEECSYVAPSELEDDDGKQPLMSNSSQTGSREDDFVKQSFANGYYQGQQYSQVQEQIVPLGEQKEADDTDIEPNKIYCHSSMTGKTVEIVPQKTRKFLFANLPGKPDELESPVYEYNPIEEQDKKPKQDKKKNHESRSYGIFDQTMQRRANPVGIQEAVSYPQGYVQARYQTKSNYYEQPTLNINLPNQETYNKSVVNQQFDVAAIAEHYHSQYPNYIFTNDSCPICYQGG
ncbi:hypothetical protein [Spiroplasma endosymbiont of Lonchoptera lutea]|uniref:hypothetical protein n=1 Tax=Spiroplasma endosymbiont of Lonchoptera lutea TaxID=3066297 RepID=UPI0030D53D2D